MPHASTLNDLRPYCRAIAPGATFFDELAAALLDCAGRLDNAGGLATFQVLVPALPMVAELRTAISRIADTPVQLPRFDTWRHWINTLPLTDTPQPMPVSERQVILYAALRQRRWFDDAMLWGIVQEMSSLSDEISRANLLLPSSEQTLLAELERAYALRNSNALTFEARVIHELWHTLSTMAPDAEAVYALRLSRASQPQGVDVPLFVLLDAPPNEALSVAEQAFFARYGETRPLFLFHPEMREEERSALATVLNAAWEKTPECPLHERASMIAARCPSSPLADRLQLRPTTGREQEAHTALRQIATWLSEGRQRIAVIAQDRLTTRRLRALLERQRILVADETGWLLSTSRAAATIDALLEVIAGNAYHRDVVDLCRSPFLLADLPETEHAEATMAIEQVIARHSIRASLEKIRQGLISAHLGDDAPAFELLRRVSQSVALLAAKPAPLAQWQTRLMHALEVLGVKVAFAADIAGQSLLELLELRRDELSGNTTRFSFAAWRDWLNREFEATSYRDSRVVSPIVITALNAACLRRFDAAIIVGGDARQLSPSCGQAFFNQSVRRELGLRTREDSERELRRDLELLWASVPQIAVTWQSVQNGEANLPAAEISLLSCLHQLAWQDDLLRPPTEAELDDAPQADTFPGLTRQARPAAVAALLPTRLSVSAYTSLIGCPYRFFARHVLRLGEMDEVADSLEKRDYGDLIHQALERFHSLTPVVSELAPDVALASLKACSEEVFQRAIADNFLSLGWRLRWERRLEAYLEWQREREAAGWRWHRAETPIARQITFDAGRSVELYGRIDRVDLLKGQGHTAALYDYKAQNARAIRERLADDVQLPSYALMWQEAREAAYVALDDDRISCISAGDEEVLQRNAVAQGERLGALFAALERGAPLPANGIERLCRHCEMQGLCRHAQVAEDPQAGATSPVDDDRTARM